MGFIFCILAGAAMSLQGVMNTRLGEGIGTMEANAFVQVTAALLSLAALLFYRNGSFAALGGVNRLFLLGGALGLVITISVMLGIKNLSPTVAISTILISQLMVAAVIDAFGLMDTEKIIFGWTKLLGLALMICGVLVFKK
ncbi:MAG: EamA-like transporter family protein [Clostridia bacterium]|nr:EamA-like transporter family protein [Clostridia bacterium]